MGSLSSKVAVVTGASRGIGRATAERLAEDGASVVVNFARSAQEADDVVAAIESKGGRAVAVQADVVDLDALKRLFATTIETFAGLDILVNNAGTGFFSPIVETSVEDYDRTFAVNARGTFFAMKEGAQVMNDGGRIVNISTAATAQGGAGLAYYGGSKAAVEQFTTAAAHELAPRGITVNTVSPGFTDTAMLLEEYRELGAQASPFKRLGQPEDIADVVMFLVSERGRWLTGQNIQAGGGVVM